MTQTLHLPHPPRLRRTPFRREPGSASPDSDIYLATPEERAATVQAALDAGITYFHAAYEREAQSLGTSLKDPGHPEKSPSAQPTAMRWTAARTRKTAPRRPSAARLPASRNCSAWTR